MAKERILTLEKLGEDMRNNFGSFLNAEKQLRVYVKPYTKEIRDDLEMYRTMPYAQQTMTVTEENGTYTLTSVKSVESYEDFLKMMHGELYLWWAKVRQYLGNCNDVVMELNPSDGTTKVRALWGKNDMGMPVNREDFFKNYYPTRISKEYIKPDEAPEFFSAA